MEWTPYLDSSCDGHFLSQIDTLDMVSSESAFADLTYLPSPYGDEEKNNKNSLESVTSTPPRLLDSIVVTERKYVHSSHATMWQAAIYLYQNQWHVHGGSGASGGSLQQKLLSLSSRLCYGCFCSDDNHPLNQVLMQKNKTSPVNLLSKLATTKWVTNVNIGNLIYSYH